MDAKILVFSNTLVNNHDANSPQQVKFRQKMPEKALFYREKRHFGRISLILFANKVDFQIIKEKSSKFADPRAKYSYF